MEKLDLYYIDLKYIRNLSNADDNVMSISPQRGKENRPFVGIVVMVNGRKYCIPLFHVFFGEKFFGQEELLKF